MRILTPIAKLLTAKQAVAVLSECIEAFGGAGYVEDTGLPLLLRDTQVLPIWEGTTNVLALDAVLRGNVDAGLSAMEKRIAAGVSSARHSELTKAGDKAAAAIKRTRAWLQQNADPTRLQSSARRLAMTAGRALELALLVEHAQWQLDTDNDGSGVAAAKRFASAGVDFLGDFDPADAATLA